jgi:hypothetical protein
MKREAESLKTTPAALVDELATEPPKCFKCGSTVGVSEYGISVDGNLLELQVRFCSEHGERFILIAGTLLGELLRERTA